ncbi:protein HESO1-like [Andrographis paniculata]|uniref:protein HESO1-like n=1 Tax=Andrographis paniculata TaxID=175694 RepID=UPI0021E86863|nr:protein HESO1-like [Andrographis paniculata]
MAYHRKVLQKKAEKFELKKLQDAKVAKEQLSALEPLLLEVYDSWRPKPSDYQARKDLVCVFNEIAQQIYGNSKDIPIVVEFGSFVMDLFSLTSDLDLSVNFQSGDGTFSRQKKIQTLRKFARKLYAIQIKGHVSRVLPVTSAKVPILKCVDCGTGVECDLSVENRDGILKSEIIRIILSTEQRFHKLSFLMKTWARAHNINSSKDKTLNSLSIILLVAFHLQTRKPPILPPFSAIFEDGMDPAKLEKSISKFANYGKRNKESLAELFATLLIKLSSVEKLWPKGLCASTLTASWTSKTWDSKVACISVQDFTDPTQNVARAVGQVEVKQIYKCIETSLRHVVAFMAGQIEAVRLKELLFKPDGYGAASVPRGVHYRRQGNKSGRRPSGKRTRNYDSDAFPRGRGRLGRQQDSIPMKKMRVGEARDGTAASGWDVAEPPASSTAAARWGSPVGADAAIAGGSTDRVDTELQEVAGITLKEGGCGGGGGGGGGWERGWGGGTWKNRNAW